MKHLKFEVQPNFPMKVTITGSLYENIKSLAESELILFLDRDLKSLAKKNSELVQEIKLSNSNVTIGEQIRLVVTVLGKHFSRILSIKSEIEQVLWSYNKQVLIQSGGEFYSIYNHFSYSIDFERIETAQVKKAS